jgi:hypothetical protein
MMISMQVIPRQIKICGALDLTTVPDEKIDFSGPSHPAPICGQPHKTTT